MSIYDRMQGTASRLMDRFMQGEVLYQITGEPTGPSWNPTPGPLESYPIDATVSGVSGKYMNDSMIRMTDLEVTCSVFDAQPEMSGRIVINGRPHEIVQIQQVPGSGTVVAWKIIVRA